MENSREIYLNICRDLHVILSYEFLETEVLKYFEKSKTLISFYKGWVKDEDLNPFQIIDVLESVAEISKDTHKETALEDLDYYYSILYDNLNEFINENLTVKDVDDQKKLEELKEKDMSKLDKLEILRYHYLVWRSMKI